MKNILKTSSFILIAFIIGAFVHTTFAGSLTPTSAPASTMYTLDGIYNKLIDNTTSQAEDSASFTTPGSVSATFHSLKDIYESIPTLDATKILTGTTYMGVAGTATAGPAGEYLKKTGQTLCYDDTGNTTDPVPCTGTGQDGDTQKGIAQTYTDNGNGTITDNGTQLVWQKQDDGVSKTFHDALAYCNANTAGLAGSGWRLPNIRELQSIVDYSTANPAINSTYFPSTQSDYYWSSTTYQNPGNENNAWIVNFNNGNQDNDNKDNSNFVRCVRALPPPALSLFYILMSSIFTLEKLYRAYKDCMIGKKNTANALLFEINREKFLLELLAELQDGSYEISRHICFIVTYPTPREIFAADFRDRIVHHLLYSELYDFFDADFIPHSYANRRGKGTHRAVSTLRTNIKKIKQNAGGGYFLKLDIQSFFRSINKDILFAILKRKIQKNQVGDSAGGGTHYGLKKSCGSAVKLSFTTQRRTSSTKAIPASRCSSQKQNRFFTPKARGFPSATSPANFSPMFISMSSTSL